MKPPGSLSRWSAVWVACAALSALAWHRIIIIRPAIESAAWTYPQADGIVALYTFTTNAVLEPNMLGDASDLDTHDGTAAESTWQDGGWRTFDGVNDKVTILTTNHLVASSGAVSAWIRLATTNVPAQTIWSMADEAGTANSLFFFIGGYNKLSVAAYSNGSFYGTQATTTLVSNQWYNVGCSGNGTAWALYTNGVAFSLNGAYGTNNGMWTAHVPDIDNCTLGVLKRNTEANFFKGDLGEFAYLTNAGWSAANYLDIFSNQKGAYGL